MKHWLVNGVGRSGTTAVYEALQSVAHATEEPFQFFYEPYLWGPKTWLDNYRDVRFDNTGAMDPEGLSTHLMTPLFLTEPGSEIHQRFVRKVFPEDANALTKIIRGSGRLEDYIALIPDIRIVHVTRNPLDTINSVLGLFSYFGEEFHPSDFPRFLRERNLETVLGEDTTEAEKALAWWSEMSAAAIKVARRYPDNVYVLPHEAFSAEPAASLARLSGFLGFSSNDIAGLSFDRPVGPVTRSTNLHKEDVEAIASAADDYFATLSANSTAPLNIDPQEAAARVAGKYRNASPGHFVADVARNMSPLAVRTQLRIQKIQVKQASERIAGEKANFEKAIARKEEVFARLTEESHSSFRWLHQKNNYNADVLLREHGILRRSRVLRVVSKLAPRLAGQIEHVGQRIYVLRSAPAISCIVTSYNNGAALRTAVESVASQALPPSEIIIADDVSDGASLELARSLVDPSRGIRLIEREANVGPGLNRHLAILSARNPFITTLDGDDVYGPAKLAVEWEALKERIDTVVYSDFVYSSPANTHVVSPAVYARLDRIQRLRATLERSMSFPRDMLYSKDAYVRSGGYSAVAGMYEDWILKLRLARDIERWHHCGVVGMTYNGGVGLSSAERIIHIYWRLSAIMENYTWLRTTVGEEGISAAVMKIFNDHPDASAASRVAGRLAALSSGEKTRLVDELFSRNFGGASHGRRVAPQTAAEQVTLLEAAIVNGAHAA